MSAVSNITLRRVGRDLLVRWDSTYAAGTYYQLYIGRLLTWVGTATFARVGYPPSGASVAIDVLPLLSTDNPSEDYSSSLASPPATDRVNLTWLGGSFLGPAIAGYYVYGPSATSGGVTTSSSPIGDVPAYAAVITDGWSMGGWDDGGFGESSNDYSWTSPPLAPGTWYFGVASYDNAGNVGTPSIISATTVGPPLPPAPNANGSRLAYTFNSSTRVATLNWNASP